MLFFLHYESRARIDFFVNMFFTENFYNLDVLCNILLVTTDMLHFKINIPMLQANFYSKLWNKASESLVDIIFILLIW